MAKAEIYPDAHPPLRGLTLWLHYGRVARLLVHSRFQAQTSYRSSFYADLVAQIALISIEFVELYAVIGAVPIFAGFSFGQAVLLFGISAIIFSLGDLVFGEIENFSNYIREGKAEILLLRPLPLLLQVISNDLQIRRLSRFAMGVATCIFGAVLSKVTITPALCGFLLIGVLAGVLIFGGTFVFSGAIQFWIIDSKQFGNALVYGSNYASQYPAGALYMPLRVVFTYLIPVLLSTYLPVAYALNIRLDPLIPAWLIWLNLPMAVAFFGISLLVWRRGIRHYEGAGG